MENTTLDPKVEKIQTYVKNGGNALVVVGASAAVMVVGASLAVSGAIAVVGLFMVNFVVPLAARSIAVYRQKALTAFAEHFSEETIKEDERKEGDRIKVLEQQYTVSRSELEGAQEELEKQLSRATPEEKELLKGQIQSMQLVIDEAEDTLKTRKTDYAELQRVNKLYIALHRSASAMEKAQGSERNPEELQRIATARNSIKAKMRAALAGKTIESMNLAMQKRESLADVASFTARTAKKGGG